MKEEAAKALGLKLNPSNVSEDAWYDYLINDYIPEQGRNDMDIFIKFGFSPLSYIWWKLYCVNHMKEEMRIPFEKRIKEVFNIDIKETSNG